MVTAYVYEIQVARTVPPEVLLGFDHCRASVEPVTTMIYGWLPDQAALSGLLARLEMYGCELVAMRRFRGAPGVPVEAAEVRRAP